MSQAALKTPTEPDAASRRLQSHAVDRRKPDKLKPPLGAKTIFARRISW
jgi:hypothetical protein